MKSIQRTPLISLIMALLLAACGKDPAPAESAPAEPAHQAAVTPGYLVAVNHPLQYFAQRLSGGELEVRLLAPADIDPAQWQPSVDDMVVMQGAELVVLNGAGYSGWLDKVSLADNRLVVTAEPARDRWLEQQGKVTHSHGPEGEHAHGGYVFTTWMDMSLARVQAEVVATALGERFADGATKFTSNLEALLADIDALDAAYQAQAQRLASRQFIYSHPVYQYFERRYGVAGTSLHWEPDAMPDDAQWAALEQLAGETALFVWEAAPNEEIAARMEAMGIESVVIDPAANVGEQDWLAVQRANIERLRAIKP